MSCFVHHMIRKGIFYEMGIPASEDNADELEERISGIVGMKNADCATTWAKVREWLENPQLKETLREKLSS